jgi:N-acylneuraminate cytidylyltransferase
VNGKISIVNNVAFIFARGGSKGVPGKNIRSLHGRPLITWSIAHALAVPRIRRLIVSTDDLEIAQVAREAGAEVPFMRPPEFARDDSPEWLAWRHALQWLQQDEGRLPDAMVSIPATAPLRQPMDIDNCIDAFVGGDADVVVAVTDAHRNPWFNMVTLSADGYARLVNSPIPGTVMRRQDTPLVYDLTTVAYVVRPEFVLARPGIFAGRVKAIRVPPERALDIDTLLDFRMAEFLLLERGDPEIGKTE